MRNTYVSARPALLGAGAWLLAGSSLSAQAENFSAERPNVLFVLVDDLGWTDLGCFGSDFYETPNIDALAAEGMRFTDAYAASPVCSPTRASILTGRYPARTQLTDWIPGRTPPGAKLDIPRWTNFLRHEELTIAEVLKTAGYATANIGKWHLGKEEFYPEDQGFDLNFAGGHWGSHRSMFAPYKNQPPIPDDPEGTYLTDRVTQVAETFIEEHRDQPFFLILSHYAVHIPIEAKKALVEKYQKKGSGEHHWNPEYAAMVESVDHSTGRLLAKLDEMGLTENTMVVFFSDNGGLEHVTSNAPLREGKGTCYEGGLRVPLIVKWPGVVKPQAVCPVPVISTDFFPTLVQAAGAVVNEDHLIDGVSLMPLLSGQGPLERETLFWHYPHYDAHTPIHTAFPHGIIRKGDWKLIEFYEDGHTELYNLKTDIGEQKDLSISQPEKTDRLLAELHSWRHGVGAQMPTQNPHPDPAAFREYKEKRLWKPVGPYEQQTEFGNE